MQLIWNKCEGAVWCNLSTVNLGHAHFNAMDGVYVIWHGGPNAHTVYVGQGFVKDRLASHRVDPRIQSHKSLGLFVTWAMVYPESSKSGIEAYLARVLTPLEGEKHPSVTEIPVNLPW